jgi:membrane-associated protease RseP (regulator of RpoE activity)
MRMRMILALIVGTACVAGTAAAAPADQSQSHPSSRAERHFTTSEGRGRLGFGALQISPELRARMGAPADQGILVDAVRADSPVGRAGLQVGDIVIDVDGSAVKSAADAVQAISDRKKGDRVPLVVVRDKNRVTLNATLQDDPGTAQAFESDGSGWQQINPSEIPLEMRQLFGNGEMRRSLDDTKQRLDRLERRVEELEHKR